MSKPITTILAFHAHADVYDQWTAYAQQIGITIVLLHEHYGSTNYHRVTIVATPTQIAAAVSYHQQLTTPRQ